MADLAAVYRTGSYYYDAESKSSSAESRAKVCFRACNSAYGRSTSVFALPRISVPVPLVVGGVSAGRTALQALPGSVLMWIVRILAAATLLIVLATLLPILKSGKWWIRFLDFPRVPLALLALGVLAGWAALTSASGVLRYGSMLALVFVLVVQGMQIIPFTPVHRKEALPPTTGDGESTVRLLVANVLMTNREFNSLIDLVEGQDPDIVLLLEPDERWASAITPLHQRFPHRVEVPLANTYGMILLSRLQTSREEVRHLVASGVPSIRARVRLRSGPWFDLHCVHPIPPDIAQASSARDAELILIGREVAESKSATIVTGDLNDVAWSHTTRLFRRLSGLLDPRIGRGVFSTFPAGLPSGLLRYPLDHVFHSKEFRLARIGTLIAPGSDHLAVAASLVYEPDGRAHQTAPRSDTDDHVEANEIVDEKAEGDSRSLL